MPAPDLVIFDCDGVLVDSEIVAARVEAGMLSEAGFQITPEELAQRYAGLTFRDIMLSIEHESQMLFEASLIERAETMVDKRLRAEVKALPGAREAVAGVREPKCVCSNSSRARIDAMLKKTGLAPLFADHIYSSLETPSKLPKPAPDVFVHAASSMGAEPERTIVVEDSVHGVAGARAAGMRVVGFTGASHSHPGHADMLTEAGAETVIHRWADFGKVLTVLSEWSVPV